MIEFGSLLALDLRTIKKGEVPPDKVAGGREDYMLVCFGARDFLAAL